MSKYTTGEIAQLCGVTVRTVQYYDNRGILLPSELSEGGRRLYSEDDLKRMKVICFLRELGIPLNSISALMKEKYPERVIHILLDQQEKALREEAEERKKQLVRLEELKRSLRNLENFSLESIGDMASIMESKKQLRKTRIVMLAVGIPLEIIEIATIAHWVKSGNWMPFAIYMPILIIAAIWLSKFYLDRTAYICPECHKVFKPTFKEAFFANHTPTTRKLTCTKCGYKGFCVETWAGDIKN